MESVVKNGKIFGFIFDLLKDLVICTGDTARYGTDIILKNINHRY